MSSSTIVIVSLYFLYLEGRLLYYLVSNLSYFIAPRDYLREGVK
jgi:hypothetical protein